MFFNGDDTACLNCCFNDCFTVDRLQGVHIDDLCADALFIKHFTCDECVTGGVATCNDCHQNWLHSNNPQPYNSYGNGSAMRVSAVAWFFDNLDDVEKFAEISALPTHNHPEGIKGAQATASAIFLARSGKTKSEIKYYIAKKYNYDLSKTCDEIRPTYHHVESCQETVPQAITAFLEGGSFEEVIRLAV
ncbi:MAG: ADP-ribosylglycohydrolase family protein, partial [Clostridia bacterium]|nr:ADP-ribosylglycohydrolase family protein [Clostridia bacterium]